MVAVVHHGAIDVGDAVAVAVTELQGDEAVGAEIRRHDIDRPALAADHDLHDEHAGRVLLDDHGLDGALVPLGVLYLKPSALLVSRQNGLPVEGDLPCLRPKNCEVVWSPLAMTW